MTATYTLTGFEAKAYEMLEPTDAISAAHHAIGRVFRAMYHSALPVDRIEAMASAIAGGTIKAQSALTDMVRRGVLRSRVLAGVRHYELNYSYTI